MNRGKCLEHILKLAEEYKDKPSIQLPSKKVKPTKAAEVLLAKCKLKPKQESDSVDPLKNRALTGDQVDELRYAVEHLLSKGVPLNRNDATWLRAVECRKALYDEDEALEMILEWNELNDDPLEYSEVKMAVGSAYAGKAYDTGTKAYPDLKEAREIAREKIKEQRKNVKRKKTKTNNSTADRDNDTSDEDSENSNNGSIFRLPISLYDIVSDTTIKEKPEKVGRWISFRGKTTLFGSREKAGKSTFALYDAKYAIEQGHKVLWVGGWGDTDKDEMKAMYFEHRLDKLGKTKSKKNFFISANEELPKSWDELFYQIRAIKPDLLILDTLTSVLNTCHPTGAPDTSEAEKWNEIVSIIKPIAVELHMAVVWIHHTTKANMEEFRGSTAIAASCDYLVLMTYKNKFSFDRKFFAQGRVSMSIPHEMNLRFVSGEEGFQEIDPSEQKENSVETMTQAVKKALKQILISGKKVESGLVYKLLEDEYTLSCGRSTIRRARQELGVEVEREGNSHLWYIPVEVDATPLGKNETDNQ